MPHWVLHVATESLYQRGLCILARHGFLHFPFPEDAPSPPDLTLLDPAPPPAVCTARPVCVPSAYLEGSLAELAAQRRVGPSGSAPPTRREPAAAMPGFWACAWGQGRRRNRGSAHAMSPHAPGLSETVPPLIIPPLKDQNVQHYSLPFTDEETQTWGWGFPACLGPQDLTTSPPSRGPRVSLYPSPAWAPRLRGRLSLDTPRDLHKTNAPSFPGPSSLRLLDSQSQRPQTCQTPPSLSCISSACELSLQARLSTCPSAPPLGPNPTRPGVGSNPT